jgi:hypothetical protein
MSEKLPPDPEEMNAERSEWADTAIQAFRAMCGTDPEDAVCDLLADLHHYCDRHGYEWIAEYDRGQMHYDAETQQET